MDISITVNGRVTTLKIENTSIIDSFSQSDTKEDFIKHLIENGYAVSKCLNPIINSCGTCNQIIGEMKELTESMQIFNTGGNSSKNGQIGEIFASELFTKRNSDIQYVDTSKIDKSGDAILIINNHSIDRIMVDYKNYESPIPSDEVGKLKRDMDTQNINYGILISYRSKISKRNYIDYEMIGGKIIVFVAAYGLDILPLEMSIQYVQRLHECNILSISQQVSELVVKGNMNIITEYYETIYNLSCELSKNINTTKENHEKINKMFHGMINDGNKILTSMNILIDTAKQCIKDIHRESITSVHSLMYLNEIIDRLIDREKDQLHAKRILNITTDLNIDGFHSESDNCIHFSDIGKLQITKSKVTMIFYNHSEENCVFNPTYEDIKNKNYYIQLSDIPMKWKIIESRFRN
tara:strand:- start:569 stop:1795 length:1227 start_codon:yes stop_codon:yes gene_type:complete